mmetsp:Transcript_6066/g.7520  ORF Transcript_6066/g.7520 Transcript_6066/m.7520 type:complete len:346 (-) Transcript_6066:144-1181(-)
MSNPLSVIDGLINKIDETVPAKGVDKQPYTTLVTGDTRTKMPLFGLGTWKSIPESKVTDAVNCAIRIGYRHIDCARIYGNEREIGEVLKDHFNNGLKREDIFISSKLFNDNHAPPDGPPIRGLEISLKNLGLNYLDAFLIHWPFANTKDRPATPFSAECWSFTYKVLSECELQGLTHSIGVCNATIFKLKELLRLCVLNRTRKPAINQVELHPYLQQPKLVEFCHLNNIAVTASMPLGSPERPDRYKRDDDPLPLHNDVIKSIAKEIGCSTAQVIIRWHLQNGVICIPKATEEWMIKENLDALNITLNEDQMNRIYKIDKHHRFMRAENMRWEEDMRWEEMWDYE